ncbi:MAG: hypothetical protein ACRC54_02800 [Fusobacteriaceae bacterium]
MKGGVILFIVEGPSDHDALIPYLEQNLIESSLKVTVKEMHGDILTEFQNYSREFKVTPSNVKQELKNCILKYLATQEVKAEQIKAKDIVKIYYVTDTDYCFSQKFPHSMNKSKCLNSIFNFNFLELIKGNEIPFETIFFSKDLEHVLTGVERKYSDEEKKRIAIEFGSKSLEEENFFINTFEDTSIKTWNSYRESYDGIKKFVGKSCNMNNLLYEIFKRGR